ncbi:PA2779 family protein [Alkalilimnicola sp. S0819]|uniref:PA2779 family protein n=1 Tax=Alkalilimnicola sp. S0819 TaxID=2613922 RepID=UPI001261CDF6|nr:PA2779 family protein [Alkalilimnicola sp. S0819]KAB7623721.1 PA2779 family protein [Alkalilimnicola sp. S0819]MPQ16850.1 PA2779 family protein [Alkalilimnicola sp. S0819]
MDVSRALHGSISRALAALMLLFSVLSPAQAGLIGTDEVLGLQAATDERAELQAFLAREDIRDQLLDWGVDPLAAGERVAQLSDAEVARLHDRMAELPAAGTDLIGAAVFVFVLLLITDILGFTDIFPFTRSVR